jgi:MFS family permease
MHHLHRKHRLLKVSKELTIVRFFLAIALACIDTIWSLYMDSFGLSDSTIGFISSALVVISLLASVFIIPFLQKYNENNFMLFTLISTSLCYALIYFFDNLGFFIFMAITLTIISVMRINCFNIIFRDNTTNKDLNKEEGFLYTILNVGWLVGPLIAGFIIVTLNIKSVFLASSLFIIISSILFYLLHLKEAKKKKCDDIQFNFFTNLNRFIKRKDLRTPYLIQFGIEVWWALIYIYVPLFIIQQGLSEAVVGYFLSFLVIPLVLFEYTAGKLSQKHGFKIFFVIAFFGLALCSLIAFFCKNIIIQLVSLGIACFFMAFLEPLQDSFFFKHVKKNEEEKFYPIFSTAFHTGSFLGKIVIACVLLFLPYNFSYLAMSILMITIGIICLKIKKDFKEKQINKK